MAFQFELTFAGLAVFTFPTPSKARVLLVRTQQEGSMAHRATLAYEPKFLSESRPDGWADPLYTAPSGRLFASHQVEDEILTLEPIFAPSVTEQGLAVSGGDDENSFASVPELSRLEPELVPQPTAANPEEGIVESCLESSVSAESPIVGRLELSHGVLGAETTDKTFDFRARDDSRPLGQGPRKIAASVRLVLSGVQEVQIHSNRQANPLVLGRMDTFGRIGVSLTNEPARHRPPNPDYLGHFEMLYKVVEWQESVAPAALPRVPFFAAGGPVTVEDDICPVGSYGSPGGVP